MPPGIVVGRSALPSTPLFDRCRYGAADALHAVVHLQVDDRQRLVAQVAQRGGVVLDVLLGDLEIGALAERARESPPRRRPVRHESRADRPGRASPLQFGSSVPDTISRLSASSAVRLAFSAVTRPCRRVACSACAWTTSIGAIVPTSTRIWLSCTSLVGQLERLPRHLDRLRREDVVPVGVPDVRDDVGDRGAQLDVGDVAVDLRDDQLSPLCVDPEVAQQRLGVVERSRSSCTAGCRSALLLFVACRLLLSVAASVAAAPGEVLRQTRVVGERAGSSRRRRPATTAAGWSARSTLWFWLKARGQRRAVEGPRARDAMSCSCGIQALHRDVEVALERELTASSRVMLIVGPSPGHLHGSTVAGVCSAVFAACGSVP